MATATQLAFYPIKNLHAENVPYMVFKEAATQTFKKGEPVYLAATGYLTICGSDPAQIIGIAAEDAHNGTSAGDYSAGVYLADPQTVFCGNVGNNATFASNSAVTAQANIGTAYGIAITTTPTHKWYVDTGDTTATRVVVVDIDDRDAVGDTGGRVHFIFRSNFYQYNSTS